MTRYLKMTLGLVGATVLLGALVGSASARTFSISNQTLRATWTAMEFINSGAGVTIRCPVTLEGSLHSRTIAKVAGSLIGYITTARVAESSCSGGRARVRNETLPWHVRYLAFSGPLPNITDIVVNVINPGFDVTARFFGFEVTCSYRTGSVKGTFTREAAGALREARVEGRGLEPDQGFPCSEGELAGTSSTVTVLNSATRLTVRLI
jgi:hypothetical protein